MRTDPQLTGAAARLANKGNIDFDLLRECYHLVKRQGSATVDLRFLSLEDDCGTVACALGWFLLQHPAAEAAELSLANHEGICRRAGLCIDIGVSYAEAATILFRVTHEQALMLFQPRLRWPREGLLGGSDKVVWMKRMRTFFEAHGRTI